MKMSKVLGVLATISIAAGVVVTIWAFQPTEQSEQETIPFGEGWLIYYEISGWMNGHLTGDFIVAPENGAIAVYVMDKEAYEGYMLTGIISNTLYGEIASSGSFSVDLPSSSTYYLVFMHSDRVTEQTFDVDIRVTGILVIILVAGIAALAIGGVLAFVSFRMKAKERTDVQQQVPQATDVTLFEEKPKLP
jgi:flagellar basal body-associated protein FliL